MSRQDRPGQRAAPGVPRMPRELAAGACARHPQPGWWQSPNVAEREAAKLVCTTRCPVLAECAGWALQIRTSDDLLGILGGMTPHERAEIRKRRRKCSAAPAA